MPPQTTVPPLRVAARAAGTSAPTGAKISAASSGSGGGSVEDPGPFGAEPTGKILRRRVARPGEGEEAAALMAQHLRHDVRGRPKPVNSDERRGTRHLQGPPADQARAHQGRRRDIVVFRREREAKALVGDGQFGIAAIDLIAGEAGAIAQILVPAAAIAAFAAGPAEPRHADPVAGCEGVGAGAGRDHGADNFVARHQGQLGVGQFAVEHMKIGAAYRAGVHLDQHLMRGRLGVRQFRRSERPAGGGHQLCVHSALSPAHRV